MTDYARKMSLDLRMISEDKYSDHIDNKASHCAKMLNDYYQKYNEQKRNAVCLLRFGNIQGR